MRRDAKSDAKKADEAAKSFCNSVQYYDLSAKTCKTQGWFIGLMVVLVIVALLGIGALVYKFVLRK